MTQRALIITTLIVALVAVVAACTMMVQPGYATTLRRGLAVSENPVNPSGHGQRSIAAVEAEYEQMWAQDEHAHHP